MSQVVRWGILGPGAISRAFAKALREARGSQLLAVGSRDLGRATQFAAEFEIPHSYGSYKELAAAADVDAIYIGTPHAFHEENTILCLQHGKHVLCEKSFALNAKQAQRMIEAARERDRLLMEAMWTRFLPAMARVREVLHSGAIGAARMLQADFGFRSRFDPQSRLYNPLLGGGALLDVGIYPLSLASMLFGDPVEIHSFANLGTTGVDEEAAVLLRHADGELALLAAAMTLETSQQAFVHATEGSIRIHAPWWACTRITIARRGIAEESLEFPFRGGGYAHEIEEFTDLIQSAARDSRIMPLAESLAIMKTMDTIREQWGLVYPTE